jgi:uncharacterized protein
MRELFADTFYFLALPNQRDAAHERAVEASREFGLSILTTELCSLNWPMLCANRAIGTRSSPFAGSWKRTRFSTDPRKYRTHSSWQRTFQEPGDKEWPLTDGISFVVMQEHELSEALADDRRFEQAGFKALWI